MPPPTARTGARTPRPRPRQSRSRSAHGSADSRWPSGTAVSSTVPSARTSVGTGAHGFAWAGRMRGWMPSSRRQARSASDRPRSPNAWWSARHRAVGLVAAGGRETGRGAEELLRSRRRALVRGTGAPAHAVTGGSPGGGAACRTRDAPAEEPSRRFHPFGGRGRPVTDAARRRRDAPVDGQPPRGRDETPRAAAVSCGCAVLRPCRILGASRRCDRTAEHTTAFAEPRGPPTAFLPVVRAPVPAVVRVERRER